MGAKGAFDELSEVPPLIPTIQDVLTYQFGVIASNQSWTEMVPSPDPLNRSQVVPSKAQHESARTEPAGSGHMDDEAMDIEAAPCCDWHRRA